jgi:hypothetical protein
VRPQATVDFSLRAGAAATTLEVLNTTPLLNVTSATLGQVIELR